MSSPLPASLAGVSTDPVSGALTLFVLELCLLDAYVLIIEYLSTARFKNVARDSLQFVLHANYATRFTSHGRVND